MNRNASNMGICIGCINSLVKAMYTDRAGSGLSSHNNTTTNTHTQPCLDQLD